MFKKGHLVYPNTEKTRFKKGQKPWNDGLAKTKVCLHCKTVFKCPPSRQGMIRFCSKNCQHEAATTTRTRDKKCLECNNIIMRKSKYCRGCAQKGFRGPQWKGGITPERKILRESRRYKYWRKAIFERDNYSCQECGQKGGILQADHIKSFAFYPELRFSLENGRTLCVNCHRNSPNWGYRAVIKMRGGGVYECQG